MLPHTGSTRLDMSPILLAGSEHRGFQKTPADLHSFYVWPPPPTYRKPSSLLVRHCLGNRLAPTINAFGGEATRIKWDFQKRRREGNWTGANGPRVPLYPNHPIPSGYPAVPGPQNDVRPTNFLLYSQRRCVFGSRFSKPQQREVNNRQHSRALVFELWNEWTNGHISCDDTIIPILTYVCFALLFRSSSFALIALPCDDAGQAFPHFRPKLACVAKFQTSCFQEITFCANRLRNLIRLAFALRLLLCCTFLHPYILIPAYDLWVFQETTYALRFTWPCFRFPASFYLSHWVSSVGGEKESLADCCETLVTLVYNTHVALSVKSEFYQTRHWSLQRCRDFCVAVRNWKATWLQQLDVPRTMKVDYEGFRFCLETQKTSIKVAHLNLIPACRYKRNQVKSP